MMKQRSTLWSSLALLTIVVLAAACGRHDGKGGQPPSAVVGADQEVPHGTTVTLDGSASTDPEGAELSYLWELLSIPAGSTAVLSAPASATPTFVADVDGVYSVGLTVSDGHRRSEPATVTVTAFTGVAVIGDEHNKLAAEIRTLGYRVTSYVGQPHSENPQMSGNVIVWEDRREGVPRIYMRDLTTGEVRAVSTRTTTQRHPSINGDLILWEDFPTNSDSDIYGYRISTGEEFPVHVGPGLQKHPRSEGNQIVYRDDNLPARVRGYNLDTGDTFAIGLNPKEGPFISGDYLVYVDRRSARNDVFGYQISTGNEWAVDESASGDKAHPRIDGNYITWRAPDAGGSYDVWAWDIAGTLGFTVAVGADAQYYPEISGNWIVFIDFAGGDRDIYAYNLNNGTTVPVVEAAGEQLDHAVGPDTVIWIDRNGGGYTVRGKRLSTGEELELESSAYARALTVSGDRATWVAGVDGVSEVHTVASLGDPVTHASTGKRYLDKEVIDYNVVVFGASLTNAYALATFDAADARGAAVLGLGTYEDDMPLCAVLGQDGRFGLSYNSDYGYAPMEIEVDAAQAGHAIFQGLGTPGVVVLENADAAATYDEQSFETDTADPKSPTDWTVLAAMGPAMSYNGSPAIATFTTPAGVRVLLDGSANSDDGYQYWNDDRWTLLRNEVQFLAEE